MAILETSYIRQLRDFRQTFASVTEISEQIDMIVSVCSDLAQKHLPKHRIVPLGLTESTYLLALLTLPSEMSVQYKTQMLQRLDHLLHNFRDFVEERFGIWALLTFNFLKRWTQVFPDQTYLEIMAGNGLFSYGLRQFGQHVITTDDLSWGQSSQTTNDLWTPVIPLDALSAVKTYGTTVDAIVMVWSQDQNPIDYQVLQTVRQTCPDTNFFVLGERYGATNSSQFWRAAQLIDSKALQRVNQLYPRFDLIQDQVYLVQ